MAGAVRVVVAVPVTGDGTVTLAMVASSVRVVDFTTLRIVSYVRRPVHRAAGSAEPTTDPSRPWEASR